MLPFSASAELLKFSLCPFGLWVLIAAKSAFPSFRCRTSLSKRTRQTLASDFFFQTKFCTLG